MDGWIRMSLGMEVGLGPGDIVLHGDIVLDIADFEVLRMLPWQSFLAFYIWDAHRRHLKNTTERSMCGGDAAFCQITLTTCYPWRLTVARSSSDDKQ